MSSSIQTVCIHICFQSGITLDVGYIMSIMQSGGLVAAAGVARDPLAKDDNNINGDGDVGDEAGDDGDEFSNDIDGNIDDGLAGNSNSDNGLDGGAEGVAGAAFKPGSEGGDIDGREDGDGVGDSGADVQPDKDDGLQLGGKAALIAEKPCGKLSNDINLKGDSGLGLDAEFESGLDVSIQIDLNVEPGLEGADVGGRDAAFDINSSSERDTDRSRDGGSRGNVSEDGDTSAGLIVDPESDGSLEFSRKTAVGATKISDESGLDISSEGSNNTAVGADVEGNVDLRINIKVNFKEGGNVGLQTGFNSDTDGSAHSRDASDIDRQTTLGSDANGNGDVDGEFGNDIGAQLSRSGAPALQRALQVGIKINITTNPSLKAGPGTGTDVTSLCTEASTSKGGTTLSTETAEEIERA